ncbi:uncharacterized protein LOC130712346 [Lotus japonicus]|uniref:uncharacterized protein LOC130712346 n=1 Tax=Lotus japonicus TaxID=34305 RepID=UPI00258F3FED|nr:uncharacterized protein LOC130712346 [Lotus japonicus]
MSRYVDGGPFLAEMLAFRDGLILAWSRGMRKLICNSDCQELINVLMGHTVTVNLPHGHLLNEIRGLLAREWRVEIAWSCRDANNVADWLAKRGSGLLTGGSIVIESPNSELEVLLLKDSLWIV